MNKIVEEKERKIDSKEFEESIKEIFQIPADGEEILKNENKSFSIIGKIGKSYLLADHILRKLNTGSKVRIISSLYNQLNFVNILGGQLIDFEEEKICLNFFSKVELKENNNIRNISRLVDSIKLMINPLNEISLPPEADIYIEKAIKKAFKEKGREAGMKDILRSLKKQKKNDVLEKIITLLYPYGNKDGEYFNIFNGKQNIELNNELVLFNLKKEDRKLNQVIFNEIMNLLIDECELSSRDKEKILIIDDGESILEEHSSEKIKKAIKRYERFNGTINITFSEINRKNTDLLKEFPINFTLYKEHTLQDCTFLNVNKENILDSEIKSDFHWIFTEHPKDYKKINEKMEKSNLKERDARIFLAKK